MFLSCQHRPAVRGFWQVCPHPLDLHTYPSGHEPKRASPSASTVEHASTHSPISCLREAALLTPWTTAKLNLKLNDQNKMLPVKNYHYFYLLNLSMRVFFKIILVWFFVFLQKSGTGPETSPHLRKIKCIKFLRAVLSKKSPLSQLTFLVTQKFLYLIVEDRYSKRANIEQPRESLHLASTSCWRLTRTIGSFETCNLEFSFEEIVGFNFFKKQ